MLYLYPARRACSQNDIYNFLDVKVCFFEGSGCGNGGDEYCISSAVNFSTFLHMYEFAGNATYSTEASGTMWFKSSAFRLFATCAGTPPNRHTQQFSPMLFSSLPDASVLSIDYSSVLAFCSYPLLLLNGNTEVPKATPGAVDQSDVNDI